MTWWAAFPAAALAGVLAATLTALAISLPLTDDDLYEPTDWEDR